MTASRTLALTAFDVTIKFLFLVYASVIFLDLVVLLPGRLD